MKWATIALFVRFVLQILKEQGINLNEILKDFEESEGVHPLALRDIRATLQGLGCDVELPKDRLAVEAEQGVEEAQNEQPPTDPLPQPAAQETGTFPEPPKESEATQEAPADTDRSFRS